MKTVKFSDVVTRANTKEDRFNTDKIYYVGGEHIDSNEMKIEKRGVIAGSTIGPMFYCGFKSGDILFVTRNPHLRKCGVVNFDGICSEKTFVLETKNRDILLQEYLAIVMQSDDFWNYCEENKSGGVNYFLNWSTLAEYEFYLPSLAEQKVLAEKLWAAYEVKQSYLKMIAATEEMVKAHFIEMFGDPISNPKGWPVKNMKESSVLLSDGPFGSNLKSEHYCEEGVRVIRLQNICLGYFDDTDKAYISVTHYEKLKKYTCKPGEIVIGTLGEPNFRACIIPSHINLSINKADCVHYIPKAYLLNNTFACSYINCERTLQMATSNIHGTTRARIAAGQVNNIPIYIPPINLQKEFETIYNQADKSISELRKSIDAIDKVIKSLINENL